MARGRKGGQRSGRVQSAARRPRYYESSVKRAKPGYAKGGADVWRVRKREREDWYIVIGRTEVWNKRGSATTSETRPCTRRSQGCQRVLGGIQNLLGIGIKESLS